MTCAEYREKARISSNNLEWEQAARFFEQAIETYPYDPAVSALARRDIEMLERERQECLYMGRRKDQ